jgi:hypothetical protein
MLNYKHVVHLSTLCFFRLHFKLSPHLYLDLPSGPFECYINIFSFISSFLEIFQNSCPFLAFLFRHTDVWSTVKSNHSTHTNLKVSKCILRFWPVIFVLHLPHIVTKFTYNLTSKQSPELFASSRRNLPILCRCRRFAAFTELFC